jgi:hypothetical protein
MDYKKVYDALIEKRRVRQPLNKDEKGCENHHIVPRSEGGTNVSENIIRLTVKEHIFAHQLLARIYDDQSSWFAAHLMLSMNKNNKCLRLAAIARKKMADGLRGENNPLYGRHLFGDKNPFYGKHHSDETRRILSEKKMGKPSYWKGKHLTEETKKKLSLARKGKPNFLARGPRYSESEKQKLITLQKNRKSIIQMDDLGNVIQMFPSIRNAEKVTNINRRCIKWCLDGEQKHAGGFCWIYAEASK